jgi:hypothetical protein
MRGARHGRPSCLLAPSKVDRRTSLGRQAGASLGELGWEVGPALVQRAAHAEAFRAGTWIGMHAPGSAGHIEVCALVEQVERLLARCKAAEEPEPEQIRVDLPLPIAPAPGRPGTLSRIGAPVRVGAACVALMAAVLAKLRRAEQQAYF